MQNRERKRADAATTGEHEHRSRWHPLAYCSRFCMLSGCIRVAAKATLRVHFDHTRFA